MNLKCGALGYVMTLLALLPMNPLGGFAQAALRSAASEADSVAASAGGTPVYHISVSVLPTCIDF